MDDEKTENFTNDDIVLYLRKFQDDVTRNSKTLEKKVENIERNGKTIEMKVESIEKKIDEKIERLKNDMGIKLDANKQQNEDALEELTKRLEKMERFVKRTDDKINKTNEKKDDKTEETPKDPLQMEKSWHEELVEIETEDIGIIAMSSQTSEWIKKHVKNGKQTKKKDEKIHDREKKERKETGMKKLKSWFLEDDSTDESEISSEEGENTDEEIWEGVERKKRNKIKKEKQKKKKNKVEEKTAEKASKMIGLGPITKESIEFFEKRGNTFEDAKIEAAKEFL